MRTASLSDVCDISMGQAPKGTSYNTEGTGYPLLAGAGDFGDLTPASSKFTVQPTKVSKQHDILLCIRATIGDLNWSDKEYCLGRGVAGLRPKNGCLDRNYLWRWLTFARPALEQKARGSTFKQVSRKDIAELEISLPETLEEQRRIAAILDKADAIRRKREQALALADDLLKSTFLDMFGDPVTNPKGWPTATLDDLGDVQGGLQVSRKRDANELKLPYLRVANVFRDRLELDEIKMIGLTSKERERVALRKGDVLIVEGHGNPDEIGRSAVWDGSIEDCVHQNHLIRFRPIPGKLDPEYASRLLNSTGGRLQLVAAGRTTSGLNTISTSKVKAVTIPVPPFGLQTRFHEFCDQVSALKSKLSAASELGSDLFGSLSQRAFRGEL